MQIAVGLGAVLDGSAHQPGNLRPFQMNGSVARGVEQTVHGDKRLTGSQTFFREFATRRQAAMKPKGREQRLSDSVNMRQAAL